MQRCWMRWVNDMLLRERKAGLKLEYRIQLRLFELPANASGTGTKGDERWLAAVRAKVNFVMQLAYELPLRSLLVFTDLDVLPFRSYTALFPLPHEITFMREPAGHGGRTGRHIVNTGLYALRVSHITRKFLGHWAWCHSRRGPAKQYGKLMDQDTANMILLNPRSRRNYEIDWGTWPLTLVTGSLQEVTNSTAAYHAIFATGDDKFAQLSDALRQGRRGPPACEPVDTAKTVTSLLPGAATDTQGTVVSTDKHGQVILFGSAHERSDSEDSRDRTDT